MKSWILLVVMIAITTIVSESVKLLFTKGVIARAIDKIRKTPPAMRRVIAHFVHMVLEMVSFDFMVGFLVWMWLQNPAVKTFRDLFWGIFFLWLGWRTFENFGKAFFDWYWARYRWIEEKKNQPELLLEK